MLPVILLGYANDADSAHLPLLNQESEEIWRALKPLQDKNYLQLYDKRNLTVDALLLDIQSSADALTIFHFAGHAGIDALGLEGGDAQATGLAQVLGGLKGLKLVFLNGCCTAGQVSLLQAAGVRCIIATSIPIEDDKAMFFSTSFYRGLAQKRTIEEAFLFAKAAVETKYKYSPPITITRGAGPALLDADVLNKPSVQDLFGIWKLYLTDDADQAALDYRLPYYYEFKFSKSTTDYIYDNIALNRDIISLMLQSMCRYNKDIYTQLVETKNGIEQEKDASTYMDVILQNVPWMIGQQLSLLRQKDLQNIDRLEHLISTYVVTSRVLYYIMVSNFWMLSRTKGIALPPNFKKDNLITRENLITFPYIARILSFIDYFETHKLALFIPELKDFHSVMTGKNSQPFERYLYDMTTKVAAIDDTTVAKACFETERSLAVFMSSVGFLASYRFTMVRGTNLFNPLYGDLEYDVQLGSLNPINLDGPVYYQNAKNKRKKTYSPRNCIVLLRNEDDLSDNLNLSPFVIDLNTYRTKTKPDIYMYAFLEKGRHYYHANLHSLYIALRDAKGTDLRHTDMTEDDFDNGRNIRQNEIADDALSGLDELFSQLSGHTASSVESPKVLEEITELLTLFENDVLVD
jgi:hypothetical protein